MPLKKTVYLALGSNLGDREQNLEQAIRSLAHEPIELIRSSSIYETAPMILENQPWFLNQVIEVRTALFPLQLLHIAQRIELELGRKRMIANGPRTIDIDVLLYGRTVMASKELTIPHPRMAERRFVLEPLVEIAPDLKHPVLKQKMTELLAAAKQQDVRVFRREEPRGL
ncbi:MAG TPA: 2-amino-4-hydroxy-6-hydroxymethyldihydropteridine diphosphokinase [Bryobacteraceae bacterium]|jgi:2-amino-4-hydroxy-6-hydroxymethyldihydropteridine diphosphokinase